MTKMNECKIRRLNWMLKFIKEIIFSKVILFKDWCGHGA